MTGMPQRGKRQASPALLVFEGEVDQVRAEYRKRERQAPGSGDLWISTRSVILQQAREAAETASPQVPMGSGVGPAVELQRGDSNGRTASGRPHRAGARESRGLRGLLSTRGGAS